MKVRYDFVSNSSSSSFICFPEDAKDIELFNKSERLSLHEYLNHFGEQDIMPWYWYEEKKKMKFVDDEKFSEMFASGVAYVLPRSAKAAYESNPKEWKEIMPYVEKALTPKWGNIIFEYYEAEDSAQYGNPDEYDYDDNEESYLENWFDHHDMKFSRIFNNH